MTVVKGRLGGGKDTGKREAAMEGRKGKERDGRGWLE